MLLNIEYIYKHNQGEHSILQYENILYITEEEKLKTKESINKL